MWSMHITLLKTVSAATLLEAMKPQWQLIHGSIVDSSRGIATLILYVYYMYIVCTFLKDSSSILCLVGGIPTALNGKIQVMFQSPQTSSILIHFQVASGKLT